VSDGASSDTASYELEQPSMPCLRAANHSLSVGENETHDRPARRADVIGDEMTSAERYVSSPQLANGPNDGATMGAEKLPMQNDNLIAWTDEVASSSAGRNERDWLDVNEQSIGTVLHRTNSDTSLLAVNI